MISLMIPLLAVLWTPSSAQAQGHPRARAATECQERTPKIKTEDLPQCIEARMYFLQLKEQFGSLEKVKKIVLANPDAVPNPPCKEEFKCLDLYQFADRDEAMALYAIRASKDAASTE